MADDDLKRQLAQLLRETRALLSKVPAAMAYIDHEQRIRLANERFDAWTSAAFPGGAVDRSLAELSGGRYPNLRPYVEHVLEGRPVTFEDTVQESNGQPCWIRIILAPGFEAGEVQGCVMMATDVTRSRHAEQEIKRRAHAMRLGDTVTEPSAQLRELRRRSLHAAWLRAEEETAGAVAQAISNPLATLLGMVEMAEQSMIGLISALDRIRSLAKHLENVVQGTLSLYHGSVDVLLESPASLVDAVKVNLLALARTRPMEIAIEIEPGLPLVFANRTLLGSALRCVGENALEASPEHGRVWVEAEHVQEHRIVRIRIADDGAGIPQSLRAKVLEPFFTTKSSGLGLGLAFAWAVALGHGGSLRIGDRPGGGASVEIDLPTAPGGALDVDGGSLGSMPLAKSGALACLARAPAAR